MEDYSTRPVGEIFKFKNVTLEIIKVDSIYCGECYFHKRNLDPECIYKTKPDLGYCSAIDRTDNENVIFKLV